MQHFQGKQFLGTVRLAKNSKKAIAQGPFIDVRPDVDVNVPVSLDLDLGGLPLSLGLFIGSGLSFLARSQLQDKWAKGAAFVLGAGLGVGGILNLLRKGMPGSGAPQPGTNVPQVSPSAPAGTVTGSRGYTPADIYAYDTITGKITYPSEGEEVDLGPFSGSLPVRIQLYNASSSPATISVELVSTESPVGGDAVQSTVPMQVSLSPGEIKDTDINLPLKAWGAFTDYVEVYLELKKRRTPSEGSEIIASRSFVIE